MASALEIVSLNVRGLRDSGKRRVVFNKLRSKCKGLILLQETHSTTDIEKVWSSEFGGNIIYSHGNTQSRGAAILIHNSVDIDVNGSSVDCNGRFVILDINFQGDRYVIGNLYAPTRDNEREQIIVFEQFKQKIIALDCENIIIAGDFNLYMEPSLDRGQNILDSNDNQNYRKELVSWLDTLSLIDIWRIKYPELKRFTWHQGKKNARLDYFFISDHLENVTQEVSIHPGFRSDHSLIYLSINKFPEHKRGVGYWKFNCSFLRDEEFVNGIKKCITNSKANYAHLGDKGLLWEMVKMEIRILAINFASQKKKERDKLYYQLTKELEKLQVNMDNNPEDNIVQQFSMVKEQIEQIENHKLQGIITRAKARWIEEGEKNTAYFLSLEKRNYQNKLITQIVTEQGMITEPSNILEEAASFYKNLYSEKNNDTSLDFINEFTSPDIPKLTDEQRELCEGPLTVSECTAAVKELQNGKSPGSDGLPSEFYKFFWNDIKYLVTDSLNYSLIKGELSIEQRRGILTLIPKKKKNRLYLQNWRPITLLNIDYKILTKALALRLCNVLPFLIHSDQTGYLKSRFIGENIRVIDDIITYTSMKNIPGIILAVDFEKAFDTVRWSFIENTLTAFNFGDSFKKWISVIYSNIITSVINNGHLSPGFRPERGIRQGCPISAFLFIMVVELLAIRIRKDENVNGIPISDKSVKISQLADDTTCFVSDLLSVKQILDILDNFYKCAGLKVNVNKTSAMYIGSLQGCKHYPYGLNWINGPFQSLGVVFTSNEHENYMLNYKDKINTLRNLLIMWSRRNLSLKGKVTVLNALALSPFNYLAQVMPVPNQAIKEINELVLKFFWNYKSPKIAKNVIIQKIECGGLKLTDMEAKVKSLRVCWVKRILHKRDASWKWFAQHFYETPDLLFYFNCKSPPAISESAPTFYREIHKYWAEIHNFEPTTYEDICSEIIWKNQFIHIQKKHFLWQRWKNKGILTIDNLLDDSGLFLSHVDINEKYDLNCNFLDVLQIRQSLPYKWRQTLSAVTPRVTCGEQRCCAVIVRDKVTDIECVKNNDIYWLYVNKKETEPAGVRKWNQVFHIENKTWEKIYKLPYIVTTETKLQSFQYRIINRIIPCNAWLKQIGIKNSDECEYCGKKDSITHFFMECKNVCDFWTFLFNWWCGILNTELDMIEEEMIFGVIDNREPMHFKILNYCILMGKYYIYKRRLYYNNNIPLYSFLVELKQKLEIKRYVSYKNNEPWKFKEWKILYDIM